MRKEEIYNKYISDIYRYSYFKTRNKEKAEDITSETFLRFFEKTEAVDILNYKSYLLGITRNIMFEGFKQSVKETDLDTDKFDNDIAEETIDIDKKVLDDETIKLIKKNLDKINDLTREIIVLKIWEELQFNEIAVIINAKVSAVKLRYYRGIEELKLLVGEKNNSKKIYGLTLPLIVGGIYEIAKIQEFHIANYEIIKMGHKLNLSTNLILKNISMNNIGNSAIGVTEAKGVLSTLTAKIIAGLVVTTVAVTATAVTINQINKPDNKAPVSYTLDSTVKKLNNIALNQEVNSSSSTISSIDNSSSAISTLSLVNNSSSSTANLTINNLDGTSLNLSYPSNWSMKKFNNNNSYSFISPTGSAIGYDFAQYNGIQNCENSNITYINNPNQKLARYFDDKSNKGVNWYVCDYDSLNNYYYQNNYDLLTIQANNDNDLQVIDQIISSIARHKTNTAVVIGKVFKFSFEYNPNLGKIIDHTSITYNPDHSIFCSGENINFDNNKYLNLGIIYGQTDGCYPGVGEDNSSKKVQLNTRDNKIISDIQYRFDDSNFKVNGGLRYSISTKYYFDNHIQTQSTAIPYGGSMFNINSSLPDDQNLLNNTHVQIKTIVNSLTFDNGLLNNKFDSVRQQ